LCRRCTKRIVHPASVQESDDWVVFLNEAKFGFPQRQAPLKYQIFRDVACTHSKTVFEFPEKGVNFIANVCNINRDDNKRPLKLNILTISNHP